jgi:ADP-ribosylation factor-like protein 8
VVPAAASPSLFRRLSLLPKTVYQWLLSWFLSKTLEISLVGLPNAGKTSLVHAMTSEPLSPHPMPTIGFAMRKVTVGGVTIKIWDLGGQPRFRPMWERYSRGVDVVVWVVDSADLEGIELAREDLVALLGRKSLFGISVLVVGNKSDLEGSLGVEELQEKMLTACNDGMGGEREMAVMKASCLTGEGIREVVTWLGKKGR